MRRALCPSSERVLLFLMFFSSFRFFEIVIYISSYFFRDLIPCLLSVQKIWTHPMINGPAIYGQLVLSKVYSSRTLQGVKLIGGDVVVLMTLAFQYTEQSLGVHDLYWTDRVWVPCKVLVESEACCFSVREQSIIHGWTVSISSMSNLEPKKNKIWWKCENCSPHWDISDNFRASGRDCGGWTQVLLIERANRCKK